MAKLDWEKLSRQSKIQSANERYSPSNSIKEYARKEGVWMQKGKYFEKPISSLPFDYLDWVIENPKIRTHFKKQAQDELRRRYQELSNT
jgi:hypothetical protein